MRRFNYKMSGTFETRLKHFRLSPIFMYDTVPGETWNGEISAKLMTGATSDLLMNRFFYDLFVFYCPYRLVWKDFPAWVSNRDFDGYVNSPDDEVPSIGYVAANTPIPDGNDMWLKSTQWVTNNFKHSVLPHRIYQRIFNRYFRFQGDPEIGDEVDTDITLLQTVSPKARDYHTRLFLVQDEASADISSANTVDDLKSAFAADRFLKVKSMYGDKYTDYLRSLGVQTSWSVLEEPELVARKSGSYQYVLTANTSEDPAPDIELGRKGGYYQGEARLRLKKTFTPEHGLLFGVCVSRMESPIASYTHPTYAKRLRDDFWSPEFDMQARAPQDVERTRLVANAAAGGFPVSFQNPPEKFLDYKCGLNLGAFQTAPEGGEAKDFYFARENIANLDTEAVMRNRILRPAEGDYEGAFSDEVDRFGTIVTQTHLRKLSPVAKHTGTYIR